MNTQDRIAFNAEKAERARLTYLALDYLVQSNDVVGDLNTDEISLLETMAAEAAKENSRLN